MLHGQRISLFETGHKCSCCCILAESSLELFPFEGKSGENFTPNGTVQRQDVCVQFQAFENPSVRFHPSETTPY